MAQNDPKHTQRFDSIENVENMWFVLEGFEGFGEVESVEELHGG